MTKVCRLCLAKLQRGSRYFNINAVESFTGFMPYRDQLTTCIPEMALDLIPNPVICNNCRNALKSSYDFKSRCLLVEARIRAYVESQDINATEYDLSEIDTSNLPKATRFELEFLNKNPPKLVPIVPKPEEPKPPANSLSSSTTSASILSNLLTVKEEVVLPNPSEIEITNVKPKLKSSPAKTSSTSAATASTALPLKPPISTEPVKQVKMEKDEFGLFTCNHCDKKFPNLPSLHTHKTRAHEEDYLCNFCNVPFKSLQNLRKHNQQCQKAKSFVTAVETAQFKRPHLPTKAKNHLKRWLFDHTDHPYPSDLEKQQLMKETNLSLLQVENWFINARRRILADLTRLKIMRGGKANLRGKRGGRGRGRGRVKVEIMDAVEDEIFDDESFEDSIDAMEPRPRRLRGFDTMNEEGQSSSMLDESADDVDAPGEDQNEGINTVFSSAEDPESESENPLEDPLSEPLELSNIKMEIVEDVDER